MLSLFTTFLKPKTKLMYCNLRRKLSFQNLLERLPTHSTPIIETNIQSNTHPSSANFTPFEITPRKRKASSPMENSYVFRTPPQFPRLSAHDPLPDRNNNAAFPPRHRQTSHLAVADKVVTHSHSLSLAPFIVLSLFLSRYSVLILLMMFLKSCIVFILIML